jgi:rhamnose transport system permease protein
VKSAYRRELAVAAVLGLLLLIDARAAGFFAFDNFRDLVVDNATVLLAAIGMTAVILCGEIDLSVGSVYAVCQIAAGHLAKLGVPTPLLVVVAPLLGGLCGAVNGALVVGAEIPSIIVTLAVMVGVRGALRWGTGGEWVRDLPAGFQWLGLGQTGGQAFLVLVAVVVFAAAVWASRSLAAGRALYAVGADREAARLAGIRPRRVVFGAFVLMGLLAGLAAFLQAIRFSAVQADAGLHLEMQVIACVVVGGTAITGGRGTLWGTLAGVALLGVIGTSLTFQHVNPAWERAVQGAIILAAVAWDAGGRRHE